MIAELEAARIRPSFSAGFARNRGQSAFPQFWRGLIGGVFPALGLRGNYLFDHARVQHPDPITESTIVTAASPIGPAIGNETTSSGGHFQWAGNASAGNAWKRMVPPFTLCWFGLVESTQPTPTLVPIFATDTQSVFPSVLPRGFNWLVDASGVDRMNFAAYAASGGAFSSILTDDDVVTMDTWHALAVRCWGEPLRGEFHVSDPQTADFWVDGLPVATSDDDKSTTAGHANASASPLGANSVGSGYRIKTAAFAGYSRLLSQWELAAWARMPLLQFVPGWTYPAELEALIMSLNQAIKRDKPAAQRKRGGAVWRRPFLPPAKPKPRHLIRRPRRLREAPAIRRRGAFLENAGQGGAAAVLPAGGGSLAAPKGTALVRRRSQIRTTYHVAAAAEYRFYYTLGAPPQEGDTPFATNATLDGFSPPDLYADGDHYFSVSYFNGVVDSGFLPVGPNGETYQRVIVVGGSEVNPPPNAPYDVQLEQGEAGTVKVRARYAESGPTRATEWAVAYTDDGSTPPEDTPDIVQAMSGGPFEILELLLGPISPPGATVKVRVQTRLGSNYSDGSQVLTTTADWTGPTAPADIDLFLG